MNERLEAMSAAIRFIESHLRDPVTVADTAAAAGYSLYHFIRTFNQTVQHTPYNYLMRRRLAEAARELLDTERRVIDIALDFQFNNHETFTRAFRRVFGMPPSHWREQGVADSHLLMPVLDKDYLAYINASAFEAPEIIELEKIGLTGWMTSINSDPQGVSSLWQNLRRAVRDLSFPSGPPDFWGVRIPPQNAGGSSFYFAGIKLPVLDFTPNPFVTKTLPAGNYLRIKHKNLAVSSRVSLTYLHHTYLPKAGYQLVDPLEIEHFGTVREIFLRVHPSKAHSKITQTKVQSKEF